MKTLYLLASLFLIIPMSGERRIDNSDVEPQNILADKAVYIVDRPFESAINTFESWIKLDSGVQDNQKGGVIFGNYYNTSFHYTGGCVYMIDFNGNFRVHYNTLTGSSAEADHVFTNFDFRTDDWVHVALTRTPTKFELFANGVKVDEFSVNTTDAYNSMRYQIGCDWTNWTKGIDGQTNRYFFRGEIKSVSVFSDVRNVSEIENDMNTNHFNSDTDGLMGSWNLGNWTKITVEDDSNFENNVRLGNNDCYIDLEETEDFDYTILGIPDIQIMTRYQQGREDRMFDHIVESADKQNVQYITFLGDLSDTCDIIGGVTTPDYPQWNQVCKNLLKFDDANLAYGFVPGNHDYDDGVGRVRSATTMNEFLPYEKYAAKDYFGGAYFAGDITNYYNIKKIYGINYLFLNLEFGPRNEVLEWANRVCEEYSDHRVIVSTHSYMEPDGTICDETDVYAPEKYGIGGGNSANNGTMMFNKFIKKHANIFMVLSGHNGSDDVLYRTDIGDNGNIIHSMLIDAQGTKTGAGVDLYTIFKFNEKDKNIHVYWYSPEKDQYFNRQNQYIIDFADENNPSIGPALRNNDAPINREENKSYRWLYPIGLCLLCVSTVTLIAVVKKEKSEKGGKENEK